MLRRIFFYTLWPSFGPIFLKVGQILCLDHILIKFNHGLSKEVGHKIKSQKSLVDTLGATFSVFCPIFLYLAQNSCLDDNSAKCYLGLGLVRMQVTRSSLRKILFTLQGPHFWPNLTRTCSGCLYWIISRSSLIIGGSGSKSRSLGQILEKSCLRSRGHSFDPIVLKLAQNVCLDYNRIKFEHG